MFDLRGNPRDSLETLERLLGGSFDDVTIGQRQRKEGASPQETGMFPYEWPKD